MKKWKVCITKKYDIVKDDFYTVEAEDYDRAWELSCDLVDDSKNDYLEDEEPCVTWTIDEVESC